VIRAFVAGGFFLAAMVAAAVVLERRGGPPSPAPVQPASAVVPAPPRDAVVLAREAGPLAVALEAEPRRLTAVVLGPSGGGRSGLRVRFLPSGAGASPCGRGCYSAAVAPERRVVVELSGRGVAQRAAFTLPSEAPVADALVRRARAYFRALPGVSYDERLASDETHVLEARWRLEKPDRIYYAVAGGAEGVVIGERRWDRAAPGKPWRESAQLPRLPQPATQWTRSTNAHVLSRDGDTVVVSFADPTVPAFYRLTLDARTLRPSLLEMTAAAHFMRDRYTSFSSRREIRRP
jgi:hypothetical protein